MQSNIAVTPLDINQPIDLNGDPFNLAGKTPEQLQAETVQKKGLSKGAKIGISLAVIFGIGLIVVLVVLLLPKSSGNGVPAGDGFDCTTKIPGDPNALYWNKTLDFNARMYVPNLTGFLDTDPQTKTLYPYFGAAFYLRFPGYNLACLGPNNCPDIQRIMLWSRVDNIQANWMVDIEVQPSPYPQTFQNAVRFEFRNARLSRVFGLLKTINPAEFHHFAYSLQILSDGVNNYVSHFKGWLDGEVIVDENVNAVQGRIDSPSTGSLNIGYTDRDTFPEFGFTPATVDTDLKQLVLFSREITDLDVANLRSADGFDQYIDQPGIIQLYRVGRGDVQGPDVFYTSSTLNCTPGKIRGIVDLVTS